MLSPFHIAVALGPLAIYLLVVAMVRLMPKPLVVSGGRDIATMSMALIGFAMVGPMELFFPKAAAMVFRPEGLDHALFALRAWSVDGHLGS